MNALLSLFVLALPTTMVCVAYYAWKSNDARWKTSTTIILVLAWAISGVLWATYARQNDDVGLIVHGVLGMASTASALCATLVALFLNRQR